MKDLLSFENLPGIQISSNQRPAHIFFNQEFQITINNCSEKNSNKSKNIDLEKLLNRKLNFNVTEEDFYKVLFYSQVLN